MKKSSTLETVLGKKDDTMISPGYYRCNFRKIHYSELLRMSGIALFPIGLMMKLFGTRTERLSYLPQKIRDSSTGEEDVGESLRENINKLRLELNVDTESLVWQTDKSSIDPANDSIGASLILTDGKFTVINLMSAKMVSKKHPNVKIERSLVYCMSFDEELNVVISTTNDLKGFNPPIRRKIDRIRGASASDIYKCHTSKIVDDFNFINTNNRERIIDLLDKISEESDSDKISRGLYEFSQNHPIEYKHECLLDCDRAIALDSEELAEGSIVDSYNIIRADLRKQGVELAEIHQVIDGSYKVSVGGVDVIVYDENTPSHGDQHWGRSTFVFFDIINSQLVGWSKRLYAINGGNDLMGIFLTDQEFSAEKNKISNKRDWPYIPIDEHPWYGMYH